MKRNMKGRSIRIPEPPLAGDPAVMDPKTCASTMDSRNLLRIS